MKLLVLEYHLILQRWQVCVSPHIRTYFWSFIKREAKDPVWATLGNAKATAQSGSPTVVCLQFLEPLTGFSI